jgi:DNA-binding transcriptional LysR family regulator
MNDITLKQVEIFITVAESLSFSEAARDLFIDQSVVSRWIQRLETNLGTKLFQRHNKGVELTPDGEFLYDEIKPVYGKLSNSFQTLKSRSSSSGYLFRIGCLDTEEVVSAFNNSVFQFKKLYPNVPLKVGLYSFDELRRRFINEELDFAVSYYMGFGEYKDTLHRILKKNQSYFVLSKDSPAIKDGAPAVEALNNEVLYLIAPAEAGWAEEYILGICQENGFQPKKIKYLPNQLAIEIAVRNNRGFTIGSDIFMKHFPEELRLFRLSGTTLGESIAIFWHSGAMHATNDHSLAKRFLDMLSML